MAAVSVQGLSVILLVSRDTESTAAFYRDVLGLPLVGEQHDGKHWHFAGPLGAVYFTIQAAADLNAPEPGKGYDFLQLCFTVADLDGFLKQLGDMKIAPLHPPMPYEHTRFITLLDPEGRHVRVMTPWQR